MRTNPTKYREILAIFNMGHRGRLSFKEVPVAAEFVTAKNLLLETLKPLPRGSDPQAKRAAYYNAKEYLHDYRYIVRSLKAQLTLSRKKDIVDEVTFQALSKKIKAVEPLFSDLAYLLRLKNDLLDSPLEHEYLLTGQNETVDAVLVRRQQVYMVVDTLALFFVIRNHVPKAYA